MMSCEYQAKITMVSCEHQAKLTMVSWEHQAKLTMQQHIGQTQTNKRLHPYVFVKHKILTHDKKKLKIEEQTITMAKIK
jgi:hypothetical protein